MSDMQPTEDLAMLAAHFASSRETILQRWRKASEADPELTTMSALTRSQFNDHIPEVLALFARTLTARRRDEKSAAADEQKASAAEHGLHRWHHGYQLKEAMREWGHLQMVLVNEMEAYAQTNPNVSPSAMIIARRALAQLFSDGISESAARYAELQHIDARGRIKDLEQAVEQLKSLDRQRADFSREAAHDLRGNVGIVRSAASLLTAPDVTDQVRNEFVSILDRNVNSLYSLMTDLLALARLEAGQEKRKIEPLDSAALLRELCTSLKPMAAERNLFLNAEGPAALPVEGDPVRVTRIAQNLLLNAIKYTEHGGVKVIWGPVSNGADHWSLCVEDTGPGITDVSLTPMKRVLKKSTEESRATESKGEGAGRSSPTAEQAPTLPSRSHHHPAASGEGIGLSIVKRLCVLLDAILEYESHPGQGSTFRVTFPCKYSA